MLYRGNYNLAGFQLLSGAWTCQFVSVDLFLLVKVGVVPTCLVGTEDPVKNGFATNSLFSYELCLGVGTCEQRFWVVWVLVWPIRGVIEEVLHDAYALLVQFAVHLCKNGIGSDSVSTLLSTLPGGTCRCVPYSCYCA